MTSKQLVIAFVATAIVFVALDAVWLSLTAQRLYRPAIGHLMADKFAVAPAAIFYPVFIAGLVYFAVHGAVQSGNPWIACRDGALFGLLAYATYDLTNQATLRGWPWSLTLIDVCWGAFVSGAAALAAARVTLAISGR